MCLQKKGKIRAASGKLFFTPWSPPGTNWKRQKMETFFVDNEYTMEIEGRTKKKQQIRSTPDAWVVKDGIETGSHETIPLWAFGFLY
jgi:hypothetical protein